MVTEHVRARKRKSHLLLKAKKQADAILWREYQDRLKKNRRIYLEKLKREKELKVAAELSDFVVQQILNDEATTAQELNNEALDYLIDYMSL